MEQFTKEYGDIDMGFYESIENTFHKALQVIDKQQLQLEFYPEVTAFATRVTKYRY